ncbi:MAG: hypothetical protein K8R59_15975 [Thermoanaerobaculales bacterium]|nr:hypothetical protein [Thermoanaerobaculales bacterium]
MRFIAYLGVCLFLMVNVPVTVHATVCASDAAPGSSLVFPFIVFDYSGATTFKNTVIGITNTGAEAQIVHIVLWTDTGTPILNFNIVLSGYDVESFDIGDMLVSGILPVTGTSGALEITGDVFPRGPVIPATGLDEPDSTVTVLDRCNEADHIGYPAYDPITQPVLELFQIWLQRSQTEDRYHQLCTGGIYSLGDWFEGRTTADPTWMWMTADVVWTCNRMFPDQAQYWQDGPSQNPAFSENGAQRMVANVLMGDVQWFDLESGWHESGLAIHLEADSTLGDSSINSPVLNPTTGMPQSFYHALSSPNGSSDLREPLPTAWAFRYVSGIDDGTTWMRVFKAPTLTPDHTFPDADVGGDLYANDCGIAYTYYAWDDDENVTTGGTQIEPNILPLYTQEVDVGDFYLPDSSGWLQFQWPRTNTDLWDLYQTWVEVRTEFSTIGLGAALRPAVPVANFNCDRGPIAISGFELGNTSGWSQSVP